MGKLGRIALLGPLLAAATAAGAAQPLAVTEFTLDNGLTVIVREDHRAPVVVSQVWYRVGSSYEHRGITGVSHVLEHMMFQGTTNHPPGEFSRIIARNGGKENAFTGQDYTAYFQQLAADRLEIAFQLEADRMHNLLLQPEEFAKERDVVIEERRLRVDDKPMRRFGERFNSVAYLASPYGHPVIGWADDLRALRLEDLASWYQQWYSPANAVLVVAGAVEPEDVRRLAERHFGKVPAREPATPRGMTGLDAPGGRVLEVQEKVQVPYLLLGYEVPSLATAEDPAEVYALQVLAMILDGGDGARLPERLVRNQGLAASAGASYGGVERLDSRFMLDATPRDDTSLEQLQEALLEQVRELQSQPVDAESLQRAKNQLLAEHLFQLDSIFYQAMQIGMLETIGVGWRELERFQDRVRAVTAKDVQRVAARYLIAQRLTAARLIPQETAAPENRS